MSLVVGTFCRAVVEKTQHLRWLIEALHTTLIETQTVIPTIPLDLGDSS